MQKILIVKTARRGYDEADLSSKVEDSTLYLEGHKEGPAKYNTPLEVLSDGWKLISAPQKAEDKIYFIWWFSKE